MPKYTKYLEFSQKERIAIRERDNYMCIFCRVGYRMPPANEMGKNMQDIMHYIPRSSLGRWSVSSHSRASPSARSSQAA